jgi:hypothetical protein
MALRSHGTRYMCRVIHLQLVDRTRTQHGEPMRTCVYLQRISEKCSVWRQRDRWSRGLSDKLWINKQWNAARSCTDVSE